MLCNYADEKNSCYPSQEHISKLCGCTRESVNKHIKRLVKLKLIKLKKVQGRVCEHNMYYIQCEKYSHNTNIKSQRFEITKKKKNKNFIAG